MKFGLVVAIGGLVVSCWMPKSQDDVKNIIVGLCTGIITSSYNGCEFVSYCRKLPDIQKSTGMPAYNREF